MGGRDARRFRVLAQRSAIRDQPARAGRGRSIDRALLRERRVRVEIETWPGALADGSDQEVRCRGFRGLFGVAAAEARWPPYSPCGGGAACELSRAGVHRVAAQIFGGG